MTMTIPQVIMTMDFPCKNHHYFLYVRKSQVFMISFNQYILFKNTNNQNIPGDYEHAYPFNTIIQCKIKNISNIINIKFKN